MLENTHKVYQLVLDTEKKFNDEKAKLVKRREALKKKIESKIPFSSATKKREARYEVEEINFSLEELEQSKKKAILDLALIPQLKQAFKDDEQTWESSADKKIDDLLEQFESDIDLLLKQSSEENNMYMNAQGDMIRYLKKAMKNSGYDIGDGGLYLELWKGIKSPYSLFKVKQTLTFMINAIDRSQDPRFLADAQFKKYNIRTQSTEEERKKEIEEKGAYHINEGNFIIVDNTKYNAWWDKEYGEKSKKK